MSNDGRLMNVLQVFATRLSTRQTVPSTSASCIAKSATAASSALKATALVVELAACPWTKANIFKRRTSECICHRTPRPRHLLLPLFLSSVLPTWSHVGSISVVLPSPRKDILHVRETENRLTNHRERL